MRKDTELAVKYQNKLNMVPLKDFNPKEMNLFFALCSRMKERGTKEISFTFEELKDLSDYKMTAIKVFTDDLDSLYSKMMQLSYRNEYDDNGSFRRFVLFTGFDVNVKNKSVKVSVNPKLEWILNDLTTEFSRFELAAFTSIRSAYSKTLFRLLVQYRSTGYYVVDIDDFRRLMDIPDYYKMGNIDQTVIKPALKELSEYFNNLKVTKIKFKKRNKIAKLEFTFSGLATDLPKVSMCNWLDN